MTARVEPSAASIAKAWRAIGGDDTWLRLKTRSGNLSQFDDAVTAANELAEGRGEGDQVWGLFATTAPDGLAVQLVRAVSLDVVNRWVADLSVQLSTRGFTGQLGGAPFVDAPPCLFPTLPPVPTAYLNWCLDPGLPTPAGRQPYAGWRVGPAATSRITTLLDDWARRPAAQLVLRQGNYSVAVELSTAAEQLARAMNETGMAGLDFITDRRTTATHTALADSGEGVFQVVGEGDWRSQVERLTTALVALPADTNLGYLRTAHRNEISQSGLHAVVPLPIGTEEYFIRYNKHLLDRYLPDAHGIQVVRTAHLDNAHDLSAWRITDLGQGRHLVQAAELQCWYGQAQPDPDVLAQARADFAGALLTEDIIKRNPRA